MLYIITAGNVFRKFARITKVNNQINLLKTTVSLTVVKEKLDGDY